MLTGAQPHTVKALGDVLARGVLAISGDDSTLAQRAARQRETAQADAAGTADFHSVPDGQKSAQSSGRSFLIGMPYSLWITAT